METRHGPTGILHTIHFGHRLEGLQITRSHHIAFEEKGRGGGGMKKKGNTRRRRRGGD